MYGIYKHRIWEDIHNAIIFNGIDNFIHLVRDQPQYTKSCFLCLALSCFREGKENTNNSMCCSKKRP